MTPPTSQILGRPFSPGAAAPSSGFRENLSADSVRQVSCDWEARVSSGTFEDRPAYRVTSAKNPAVDALVVDAGRVKDWDSAERLCAAFAGRAKWKLLKAGDILHAGLYGLLPRHEFVPGQSFGIVWSRAESELEDEKIFRGTANFTSMNLKTLTRRTVDLDEQIRRHEEILTELQAEPEDDAFAAQESRRVERVLGVLRAGVPVLLVSGHLHPYGRPAPRRATRNLRVFAV